MSRVVSGLAERKLVLRAADADDARGVRLALSKAGRKLYAGLIARRRGARRGVPQLPDARREGRRSTACSASSPARRAS